ncbi:MAG: helix-hairpin-helix domain-containing protein [Planctomycetes bacterium]|nr:helix-hairpin-helix domain-containing protein [Planctomycetota bacterium]MCL4731500.1 helix-hairpin-helix domain-containing protein [Planctomycetota bacterium]
MQTPEPEFAWYRLEGREAAVLLAVVLAVGGLWVGAALAAPGPAPVPVAGTDAAPALVRVNRAGVAELAALPGIGPRKAERIVQSRQTAPLRDMDDLARAAGGIPQSARERMAPFVRFD